MIKNYINYIINNPRRVLFFIFITLLISSLGLSNFKLDASSDALVLENDTAYKIYRESGDEFGNSDFLIVTYSPFNELFSSESLSALKSLAPPVILPLPPRRFPPWSRRRRRPIRCHLSLSLRREGAL